MTIREIREAYDKNYQEILRVITEMGGDANISYHRKKRTRLYLKLRNLQRIEHRLSHLEEALAERESFSKRHAHN